MNNLTYVAGLLHADCISFLIELVRFWCDYFYVMACLYRVV
ncbi:Protein of unknown function [Pyronema omphalodes CBS 100304]|uniref:Uncharacterized protein n=1 Tax=Pyronema omphalodes (strain CBS 100304) TaxID=1076935 RepID=U4L2P2_PYROM|nr:Protein of unknown function [Pyronema omphalodes CBS 100304]